MLVSLVGIVLVTAFFVIIFGAFSSINAKWAMRQTARAYLLIMETEGYLNGTDESALIAELNELGLYNIDLTGTTKSEVDYGSRIYLVITGTYDDNILAFADGISKVTENPTTITIKRQITAKQ